MRLLSAPLKSFFKAGWSNQLCVLAFLAAIACAVTARVVQTNIFLSGMLCTIGTLLIGLGFYAGTRNRA